MEIYKTESQIAAKHNWLLSLVVLVLIIFGVLVLNQGIALVLIPLLFDIPSEDILSLYQGELDHPNGRVALLFLQGLGSGLAMLLAGYIYSKLVDRASLGWKQQFGRVRFNSLLLIFPLLVGFILFDSIIIEWNMNVEFPSFMQGFEDFSRGLEDQAMAMTKYLTDFSGPGEFLLGLLVIGLAAGIGEEYLFRGIIQPKMHRYTGSAHWGIWISAFIFSAIHFQFYGFFPRMFLGALFGYMYVFSGSLVYPMLGHVLNNSFTLIMVYLNKLGIVEFSIDEADDFSWYAVVLGLVIFIICMRIFISQNRNISSHGKVAEGI